MMNVATGLMPKARSTWQTTTINAVPLTRFKSKGAHSFGPNRQ